MAPIPNEFLYLYSRLPRMRRVLIPTAVGAACGAAAKVYYKSPEESEREAARISSGLDQYKKKESSQISSAVD